MQHHSTNFVEGVAGMRIATSKTNDHTSALLPYTEHPAALMHLCFLNQAQHFRA